MAVLPDLSADWKAIRNLEDAIYECVSTTVDALVDEFDLDLDDDQHDALFDRIWSLATTRNTDV